MLQLTSYLPLAGLLAGGLLLGSCGGSTSDTPTSTPSSTLGTDSAATKVGGTPDTTSLAVPPTGASTSAHSTGQ